ncbi:MAG TPA: nucleotide exchange factor GrpE [Actinomycetota bacterium]|nr:nucleotide exchange factor GrpE [Actinomycetota bacterium]
MPDRRRTLRPDEKPAQPDRATGKPGVPSDAEERAEDRATRGSAEEAVPQGPGGARGAEAGDPSGAGAHRRDSGADAGDTSDAAGDELAAARAEAAEYLEHLQRLQAEFENYRKRVLREQTRAVEFATEPVMSRLLEVLDEFELALVAAEQRPDLDKFLRGVEIVYAKLLDILRAEGLERIDAEGRPFDPTQHEALFQVEGGDGEPYVVDVLRTGYRLKGRVIRPAGVKVARR